MLMYRQIDKERNVEIMKLEDFPEHIKVKIKFGLQFFIDLPSQIYETNY